MTKHPKRPRDPAQLAKLIVDIATGEVDDRDPTPEELGKDPAAVALGRRGGLTRLTNGFSKKFENHAYSVALFAMYYNFVKIHSPLRMSPAMAAGVSKTLWRLVI